MNAHGLWLMLVLAPADAGTDLPSQSETLQERLHQECLADARQWEIFLDSSRKKKAELVERPVYRWTNPTKGGGQYGSVFVWRHGGRPIVVASIFAHPSGGRRRLVHEFHSLSPTKIVAECKDGGETWEPKAPITLQPIPDAPKPESTPGKRLIQMRTLGREFGGHTVDWRKQRWELRLLPQPLVRFETPQRDGALLALVTDAGTDPEVLLLLDARDDGWHYALLRFSDSSAYVMHKEQNVWTNVRGTPGNTQDHNPDFTYQVFQKRTLDEPVEAKASSQ